MELSAIRLRNSYQIFYVDTNSLFVKHNAACLVETENGLDIGNVIKCPRQLNEKGAEVKGKLLRAMTERDLEQLPEIEMIEKKAFDICREKASMKKLDMKLISVKCLFDRTKIIFYFVAENRIDFRELVRELAAVFRTRIEMRQIGVRDEARLIGGFGLCGKELCCTHQLEEFDPVSIKMAKEQNLNLNSLKISGTCGRLLCCLGYEYPVYQVLNENMPVQGNEINAGDKICIVYSVDTLKESLQVREGDRFITIAKSDLERRGDKYFIRKEVFERLARRDDEAVEEED